MPEVLIRHINQGTYHPIRSIVDEWWGGRQMAAMLPKLFFAHFSSTSFTAVDDGQVVGFLIGFVSQAFADQAYIHFVGVLPSRRGEGLGQLLYESFCSTVASFCCRTASCVTDPVNHISVAFHRHMGFSMIDSDCMVDGVPVILGYDGAGPIQSISTSWAPAGASPLPAAP